MSVLLLKSNYVVLLHTHHNTNGIVSSVTLFIKPVLLYVRHNGMFPFHNMLKQQLSVKVPTKELKESRMAGIK
jgi:hypothetical protein